MFPEIQGDLNRLVAQSCISCGVVPDYNIAMLCFTGDVTLYVRVMDGQIKLEVDAPCLN